MLAAGQRRRAGVGIDDEQVDGVGSDVQHSQPHRESAYARQP